MLSWTTYMLNRQVKPISMCRVIVVLSSWSEHAAFHNTVSSCCLHPKLMKFLTYTRFLLERSLSRSIQEMLLLPADRLNYGVQKVMLETGGKEEEEEVEVRRRSMPFSRSN